MRLQMLVGLSDSLPAVLELDSAAEATPQGALPSC